MTDFDCESYNKREIDNLLSLRYRIEMVVENRRQEEILDLKLI